MDLSAKVKKVLYYLVNVTTLLQYREMVRKLVGVVALAAIAAMATPVASVTASGHFKLSGVDVPATAAAGVPAAFGDVISTFEDGAVVRFLNAVVTLGPKSSVRIEAKGDQIVVRLLSGSLQYKLAADSKIVILNKGQGVGTDLEGSVIASGAGKTLPIVLGSAGVAGGIGAGVALTKAPKLSGSK